MRPYLPSPLISAERYRSLLRIAELLPSTSGGFECRLAPGEDQVDVSLVILKQHPDRSLIVGEQSTPPIWTRIEEFRRTWWEGGCSWPEEVTRLWLEFDLEEPSEGLPLPRPFVQFARLPIDEATGRIPTARQTARRRQIEEAATLLAGRPLDPATAQALDELVERLPPTAGLTIVGVWPEAPADRLRVEVRAARWEELRHLLSQLGWAPESAEGARLLAPFADAPDQVTLGLDVGPAAAPVVGVLFFAWRPGQPEPDPRAGRLLDQLVAMGLCEAEKRRALLEWPGVMRDPRRPRRAGSDPDRPGPLLRRRFAHVKVSRLPNGRLHAKAYFGFWHAATQAELS